MAPKGSYTFKSICKYSAKYLNPILIYRYLHSGPFGSVLTKKTYFKAEQKT